MHKARVKPWNSERAPCWQNKHLREAVSHLDCGLSGSGTGNVFQRLARSLTFSLTVLLNHRFNRSLATFARRVIDTLRGVGEHRQARMVFVSSDGSKLNAGISERLADIVSSAPDGTTIMVDIPIGLRDDTPLPRNCDTFARKVLAPGRASSVFPAPIRSILHEPTHADASGICRKLIGKGISQQSFAIVPKIREADELLSGSEHTRLTIKGGSPGGMFLGPQWWHSYALCQEMPSGFFGANGAY